MKKVCIFVDNIYIFGGVERIVCVLSNELCKYYDLTIVSLNKRDEEVKFNLDKRIKIINILNTGEKYSFTKHIFTLRKRVKEGLKDYNPDVFIVAGMRNMMLCTFVKRKAKLIAWEHSSTFAENKPIKRGMQIGRFLAKHFADKIIVLTQRDLNNYINKLHYSKRKLFQIYNTIDYSIIPNKPYNALSKKIITIGRICEDKGFDMLVEVAQIVLKKNPDWQWHIYGDTDVVKHKTDLVELINGSSVKEQLLLEGFCNNIYDIINDYSFYVMTSRNEGFPMVLIEAHAAKLPIVSFDIDCGPNEIITNEKNGFLVKPFDVQEMTDKIDILIKNQQLRTDMSNNTSYDKEKLQLDTVVKQWRDVINNL